MTQAAACVELSSLCFCLHEQARPATSSSAARLRAGFAYETVASQATWFAGANLRLLLASNLPFFRERKRSRQFYLGEKVHVRLQPLELG
ncbi:MAG TPA: hypothetical protein VJB16_02775, partial [archaeon]|nr:hypothetical protein [archaeon]